MPAIMRTVKRGAYLLQTNCVETELVLKSMCYIQLTQAESASPRRKANWGCAQFTITRKIGAGTDTGVLPRAGAMAYA
jgi:hypothetical protein